MGIEVLKHGRFRTLAYIVPFLVLILPDISNWNGVYNTAFKYNGREAGFHQDIWLEDAYYSNLDIQPENTYFDMIVDKTTIKYPSVKDILLENPLRNLKIWMRDLLHAVSDISGSWVLPFLVIGSLLYIIKKRSKAFTLNNGMILVLGVLLHLFCTTAAVEYMGRYYLLEIVAISFAGSAALVKILPRKQIFIWVMLVAAPFIYHQTQKTEGMIKFNISIGSDDYLHYREIFNKLEVTEKPILLAREPYAPYVAGVEWHQFPKGVDDLHQYCMEKNIKFILWGQYEHYYREEWRMKLENPENASPEFTVIDASPKTGLLYYVNDLSDRHFPEIEG
jgi:hypothetical protein